MQRRQRCAPRVALVLLFGLGLICGAGGRARAGAEPGIPGAPGLGGAAGAVRSETAAIAVQALLLEGVRAFRAERYEEALALFGSVRARYAVTDIGFYEGMALHKLGRHAAALIAFRDAGRAGLREPIAAYYQAVSCYRLGMLARAQQGFQALLAASREPGGNVPIGPRLLQGAQQFLARSEQDGLALPGATPPDAPNLLKRADAALASAEASLPASPAEAAEWLAEAAELYARHPARGANLGRFQAVLARARQLTAQPASAPSALSAPSAAPAPSGATAAALDQAWCRASSDPHCPL